MADLLKSLGDPAKIRKQYRVAWVIYLLNTLVSLLLIMVYPEDRALLNVYLFAAVGPLLAQGLLIAQWPLFRRFQRLHLERIFFALITLGLALRGILGSRQDLYVYLLLGMGPLLITANAYTGVRVKELTEKGG